jgi:hypothetical protein
MLEGGYAQVKVLKWKIKKQALSNTNNNVKKPLLPTSRASI